MSRYPFAERPSGAKAESAVSCSRCGKAIVVSAWDRFNGLLVECPYCHAFHGRRWRVRAVALASFLLNALSFMFTMRPRNALLVIAVWVAFFFCTMPRSEAWPEAVQIALYCAFMVGPMLINIFLLIRHQSDLDRAPVGALPRSVARSAAQYATRFSVQQLARAPERFSAYRYLIFDGDVLVARYWHDHRVDEHGIEFVDGRTEPWPVGGVTDFLVGGGPRPLRLSEAAVVYVAQKLGSGKR